MASLREQKPALQYSDGRSKPWSGARVVNCFCEKADGDKNQDFALMLIPGLDLLGATGAVANRGAHVMGDTLYIVAGTTLYSVNSSWVATSIGSIPGSGRVTMADNGTELAICARPNGYVLSAGVIVSPTNLPTVSDVTYIDSYFVWEILDSDQCIYSGNFDGINYDPLDVFTAEGSPDGLVGIINDHRELQLYGTSTIEIWYNSGDTDNVFQRQGNAFIERGCFSRDTIVKVDNSVHFLGDDLIAYRLDGYTPTRISTHAIEYQIRNATSAWAFSYTQEGHKFYVLSTNAGTFAYDMATGSWHQRKSWAMDTYRVGFAVKAFGSTALLDYTNGNLYSPNLDSNYTENGDPISMEIGLPTIGDGTRRLTCYAFKLYCETGVGLNSGQGSDPQAILRYSKNGGRTFSNEMWRSLGAVGDYLTMAIWRGFGKFWQLQVEIKITDPVRRLVMSYLADIR